MSAVDAEFLAELESETRRQPELWEFYNFNEPEFTPERALLRLANVEHLFAGFTYAPRVLSRGGARRYIGETTNTMNLTLNNADWFFSDLDSRMKIEGLYVACRLVGVEPWNVGKSVVIFGGRARRPDNLGKANASLVIEQNATGGDEELPTRDMRILCRLAPKFKGEECRGRAALETKSEAYRNAPRCDGTRKTCVGLGNEVNFQGSAYRIVRGTFQGEQTTIGRKFFFFTKKRKRVFSAPWSSVDDTTEDTLIPEAGGIIQVETVPLMHADTGARIRTLNAISAGESETVYQIQVRRDGLLPALDSPHVALGKLGSEGQPQSLLFPGAGTFSGITWVEGEALGSNPNDANDDAPTITAIVKGRLYDLPDANTGAYTVKGWSDCGVHQARWYLRHIAGTPAQLFDDPYNVESAKYTFEPIIDDTGAEQAVLPRNLTGGVDFRAWASASGFGAKTIDKIALMLAQGKPITGGYGQAVQAYYRYINQTQPPPFISGLRLVRRRYTSNFVLKERTSLRDFLYGMLLPSFNGRLLYSPEGKVRIDIDRPALTTYLLADSLPGAQSLIVEDVTEWQRHVGALALVGAHLDGNELARVKGVEFYGLPVPLVCTATASAAATVTVTNPGTISGGDTFTPARAVVTFGGTVTPGDKVTLLIDGIELSYVLQAGDDVEATAGYFMALVNGHAALRRYVRASWSINEGSKLVIESRAGKLLLETPLKFAHTGVEEILKVEAAYGGDSPYDRPMVADSFDYPLASRQSSVNYLSGQYRAAVADWSLNPIWREAEAHREQIGKTVKQELNLGAVDNAHQAARLIKLALNKLRLCDWFATWKAGGAAFLRDIGQVVVISYRRGDGVYVRNRPVKIEDLEIDPQQVAVFVARLYRSAAYSEVVDEMQPQILLPLQTGSANNPDVPPGNGGGTITGGNTGGGDPRDQPLILT